MPTTPRHPLRRALLALLILTLGALASAQVPDTNEDWRAVTLNFYVGFSDAGFAGFECGNTGLCMLAVDVDPDFDYPQLRELVEATLIANDVDPSTVEWGEASDRFSATWRATGGAYSISAATPQEVDIWWMPDDPCAQWADVDPFDFATNVAGGTATMRQTPRVAECVGFDHQDEFGQTPLIYAITAANQTSFENVIRFSDVNHRTHAGWTPLMYAARLDSSLASTFVTQLLAAGADPAARAPDGTTAAQLAAANPGIDDRTRATLQPPPPPQAAARVEIDPRSRRIAEDYVAKLDVIAHVHLEYQREIGCGLLPQRPNECFVVDRSRPAMMSIDGRPEAGAIVVVFVTFHDGLDLTDRYGIARAIELIDAAPAGRQCSRRFRSLDPINVDWTVGSDGNLQLHFVPGPLQPHGDDHTPPPGATLLGALCH